ncbi:MAG: AI-2E family transporter [Mucilaginibacter polytrichastri]|nr:AI-2E family transporter [Mucilaginibacter polytrichastri]
MTLSSLPKTVHILLFAVLLSVILYFGAPLLIPLAVAGVLAMLFLPVCRKLEQWGLGRYVAVTASTLILIAFCAGLFALVTWQISDMADESDRIKAELGKTVKEVQGFISTRLGIPEDEQKKFIEKEREKNSDVSAMAGRVMSSISGALVNVIIVLVYLFLMLGMRSHFLRFLLKLAPEGREAETEKVAVKCTRVVQKYLGGLALMIVMLWVMYGIGFSIAGVDNAIFFAVLCGLLEIVPFVGNITGTAITVIVALTQGDGMGVVVGVVVTYALVQFIQTYIIEPLVVGGEVNLNPFFTILALVVFETIWGVPGMVLAIPLLGMVKIICDHVPALHPYGFLMGKEKKEPSAFSEKISGIFRKKKDG